MPPSTQVISALPPAQTKLGTVKDIAQESLVNGLLGNVSTPLMGIMSNTVSALTAPLDSSFRVLTSVFNKPEDRTSAMEAAASWMGLLEGTLKAAKYVGARTANRFSSTTESPTDTLSRLGIVSDITKSSKLSTQNRSFTAEKLGLNPDTITGRLADGFGAVTNTPGTILNEIDTFYKVINADRALSEKAVRMVSSGQAPDVATARKIALSDKIHRQGVAENADYYTFMNKTSMGSLAWLTDKSVEKIPGLWFIMPFKRAIAATLEQTIERSPARFLSPDLNRQFFSSDPAERATAQSRLMTGMALMTALYPVLRDNVNLDVPKKDGNWPSPADKAMFEDAYGPENSLVFNSKLYGKVAIPLDNIGPLGSMVKMIKGYERWWMNRNQGRLWDPDDLAEEETMTREAMQFVEPMVKGLYDNFWGKQIIEFADILNQSVSKQDPEQLIRYLERTGVKMLPGLTGSGYMQMIARMDDPYKKKTDEFGDVFKATFPKTIDQVSHSYAWDGTKIVASHLHNPANFDILTDVYKKEDPTRDFLLSLNVRVPAAASYVEAPPINDLGISGARVKLTDEEWAEFHRITNEGVPASQTKNGRAIPSLRTGIDMIRNNKAFHEKFTKEEMSYIVQKTIPQYREMYKAHMLRPGTDLHERFMKATQAKMELAAETRKQKLAEQKQGVQQ